MGGRHSWWHRVRAALERPTARVTTALMVVSLATAPTAVASAPMWSPPTVPQVREVAVRPVTPPARPVWTATAREVRGPDAVTWPAPGTATVDLTTVDARGADPVRRRARAGSLPIWLAPVGSARGDATARAGVRLLDRSAAAQAGVSGLLMQVYRADGVDAPDTVSVTVDYRAFADAYGGDWARRLRLVTVPDGRPLPGTNDGASVSAAVPLSGAGPTTVALAGGPSGDNGDFTATSLSPASTWQVSQQTGDFSWAYPLRVPPSVGGPKPALSLGYSSGSVDGRTAGTNTQGSWIGDGWDMWPGYIERSYRGCADDKQAVGGAEPNNKNVNSGDLCWFNANASLSFNGRSTELVRVGTTNQYRGVADDGSRVELLQNTGFGNGDQDGEYWRVTTTDGTQYFFGRHHGVGGASAGTATKSVWTAPVYGNHRDEPGHVPGDFAGSQRTQAWRWNLDYVVDPHGNTMTYFYEPEPGAYGREGDPGKRTGYVRGGWLSKVEYSSRRDAAAGIQAGARVLFDVDERCAANCYAGSEPVAANWLDTPWDQYCRPDTRCTEAMSVTFWTGKRLSRIRSQVYTGTGTAYADVDWWTLRHTYLSAGTNEGKPMWLAGLTHTGKVAGGGVPEVSDPEIIFDAGADPLANRVDGPADGRSSLYRFRIHTITTESGAQVAPTYSDRECVRSALPTPHSNTKRCFPQYYAPEGVTPTLDWFHKYRVKRLDVYDNTGGFTHEQTNYDYLDPPAWRYDDSELVQEKKRTWGQFRGYSRVRVRKGLESGVQSAVEYLYFRGMHGDKQLPSGTRTVSITDSQGVSAVDNEAFAGMVREETVLDGPTGTWVSGMINTPLLVRQTATSGPLKAWMTNVGTTRKRTKLANGGTRWTKTETKYNDDNKPTQVNDLGDESTAGDDRCARSEYVRNDSAWILDRVKRVETVGVACTATPARPADVISDVRSYFDNPDVHGAVPQRGLLVKTDEVASWSGSTPQYAQLGRTTYDANGRPLEAIDALDRRSSTEYVPVLAGPVTQTKVRNALGHVMTTTFAPAWGLAVKTVAPNNETTEFAYDALGRLTGAWAPGRSRATQTPNMQVSYLVRKNAPTAVTTKRLLPWGASGYVTSIELFDGLLRSRQIQRQAPGGGRTISDTVYDSRGLLEWTSNGYYDRSNAPPGTTLEDGTGAPEIPGVTRHQYDGAGRLRTSVFEANGDVRWRTTYRPAGERTSVTPPSGGTATTTILDARDRVVELRQYRDPANVGSDDAATFDRTTYTYTDRDQLATVVDPAGNSWVYRYDQRGRRISEQDPDRGVTTYGYDAVGQLTSTTDARGITVATTYDDIGRRTSLRDGTATGPKRAEWVYDTLPRGVGRLTRSVRYEPSGSANQYVTEVSGYDTGGRSDGIRVTVPASEGGLCAAGGLTPCTFAYGHSYWLDGQLGKLKRPAAAGLPSEELTFVFNDVGAPAGLLSPAQIYGSVAYDKVGHPAQRILGEDGAKVWLTYTVDEPTGRLRTASAVPENKPELLHYTYDRDHAGNLVRVADGPAGGQPVDTQCYRQDHLRRLTEAWTPASGDCNAAPSVAGLGGPARYWHSYGYDTIGNRRSLVQHGTTETTQTYSYPAPGGPAGSRPHAVTQITTTGAVSRTQAFGYDQSGNTTCRPQGATANTCPTGTGSQTLTWNAEGRLVTSRDGTGETTYVYDADGQRLIRRDPGGRTLYLPDGTEVRAPVSGTASGTRYYDLAGVTVAVRTPTTLTWLVSDHHNTGEAAIRNGDLAVTRRRTLPFGEVRGTAPAIWAGDKGFVGGTVDNTGLTHLGAREYDPATGRFLSVDPVMDLSDPQQWNAYAYGNNNPGTFTDPSGLAFFEGVNGEGQHTAGSGGGNPSAGSAANQHITGTPLYSPIGVSTLGGDRDHDLITVDQMASSMLGFTVTYKQLSPPLQAEVMYETWCFNNRKACEDRFGGGGVYKLLSEISGWGDAKSCLKGSASGCAWTIVGLIPVGRIGKGTLSMIKLGDEVADGLRVADDAPWKAFCSFSGDTRILMGDGSTKPIDQIEPGDDVVATDPGTGDHGARTVTAVWVHDDRLVELAVAGGVITTTEDHPFWNDTDRQWQRADMLDAGDRIFTLGRPQSGAEAVNGVVAGSERFGKAYNLTVAGIHTYYVLVGDTPVLVHNTDGCVPAMLDDTSEAYVRRQHMPGGPGVSPDKSVFNADVDLDGLVARGNSCACRGPNKNGFYERDVNYGKPVGRLSDSAGGLPTSWYRVVQDKYGGVITMHPIARPMN